jgi:prepilin-type N-terminal cleavage/methylation domain-containing protein
MTSTHTQHGLKTARGFTLTEVLVSVVLSSIVLLAVFAVSQNSSRTFQIQNDATQATDQLNFAMDLIKSDLRRAAFLTIPNSQIESYPNGIQVCGTPAGTMLQALRVVDDANNWVPPTTENGDTAIMMVGGDARSPDELVLFGAYRAEQSFPVLLTQPTEIRVQHGFGGGLAMTEDEVTAIATRMFTGAILAVYSRNDAVQFVRSVATSPAAAVPGQAEVLRIPVRDTVTDYAGVLCDFGSPWSPGRRVVPLHSVRYYIARDPENPNTPVLIREEQAYDGTVLDRIVVGSNIVDFQVWFDERQGLVGQPLTNMTLDTVVSDDSGTTNATNLAGNATSRPELVRYAHVQLSSRLQNAIPGLEEGSNVIDGLRDRVEVVEYTAAGEAIPTNEYTRVLTIRAEVELTNFGLAD